jgi:benzoyl-CoA reductase subunit C
MTGTAPPASTPSTPPAAGSPPRLLEPWPAGSFEELHAYCRELVEDTTFPTVRRWREAGGKVLGHFQVYFPEEIAAAAGLLPFKVRGAPLETRRADSRLGSYLCSILKTSLELELSGAVGFDLFVAQPICDAARNLVAVWGRNAAYPSHLLCLPQNPNSEHAAAFLREEYGRLLQAVEEVAGRRVGAADLRAAIAVFNDNRRLLRRLYALKRERPWLLGVDEAWALAAVGGLVPRGEHNELLRAALALLERRPTRRQDRIRVVLVGGFCEQPPLDLLQIVARSCYVVEDDLLIGLRFIEEDVVAGDDPLADLATAYLERSAWSPVQHDLRKPKEEMLRRWLERGQAQAAIVAAAKMCEPGLEDQVAFIETLERAGVPYFVSEFEENMASFEHLAMQLETFVENLLFE